MSYSGFIKLMGPTVHSKGCMFRIWAPNAQAVYIRGDFNDWIEDPMIKEAGGNWAIHYENVKPGEKYEFLIINQKGKKYLRNDPRARQVDQFYRKSIVVDPNNYHWHDSKYVAPKFKDYIIYQLHVGSFSGLNDGIVTINDTAKFSQIESKLNYIKEMGFNALQLMPIQEWPFDNAWGYNTYFYYTPACIYGTPDEFRHFVDVCHQTGLAVLLDLSIHSAVKRNSLWNYDGFEINGGIYHDGGKPSKWGNGFAFGRREVKDFFKDMCLMFFEEYHVDGFRLDAAQYIPFEVIQYISYFCKQKYSEKYLIAEYFPQNHVNNGDPLPAQPWDKNEDPEILDNGGFDALWKTSTYTDFKKVIDDIDVPIIGDRLTYLIKILNEQNYAKAWNTIKYLTGCHDQNGKNDPNEDKKYYVEKFGGRLNDVARAKLRMAWAINICICGTPMLFQGNEVCHSGHFTGNDIHRFNWHYVEDIIGKQTRLFVRDCNKIRLKYEALKADNQAEILYTDDQNGICAFMRSISNNKILVVVNLSNHNYDNYAVRIHLNGIKWQQVLDSQSSIYGGESISSNSNAVLEIQNDELNIKISKWSVLIFAHQLD